MAAKVLWPAVLALGCAHYTPVRSDLREAGGVRGEIVAINNDFLSEFEVRLTPASTVAAGQFRMASAATAPCSAGDAMKMLKAGDVLMSGAPDGLTLSRETVLTLEANVASVAARLPAGDAVIDIQVADAAASCLRLPVSAESTGARWVSTRRWGVDLSGAIAWNYALSRDQLPPVAGLAVRRRVGDAHLGARADFGGAYARMAAAIGPAAGVRLALGEHFAVAGELAYELAAVDQVGLAHGPRAGLALMMKRAQLKGFDPQPFLGEGLEIFGGTWFAPDRPSGAIPWYAGAGLIVAFGP